MLSHSQQIPKSVDADVAAAVVVLCNKLSRTRNFCGNEVVGRNSRPLTVNEESMILVHFLDPRHIRHVVLIPVCL